MIEHGLCKPMIVVFPNGNASEMAACETALPEKFIFNMEIIGFLLHREQNACRELSSDVHHK